MLANPINEVIVTDHGFAILQIVLPEAEVLTLSILPSERGKGHGRSLLGQALLAAEKRGVARLFLEVDEANSAARALYQEQGFVETGRRAGYYARADGSRSDAILMARDLSAHPTGK